jgi:hypothetical protein
MQPGIYPILDELNARLRASHERARAANPERWARLYPHDPSPDAAPKLEAAPKPAKGKKPQVFRERDVSRAIAGHLKAGLSVHHTMVDREGRIVIFTGQPEPTSVVPANAWDDAL